MARKRMDCRNTPSLKNCSVVIEGTEDEVVPLGAHHMVVDHGHEDSSELREGLRASLEDVDE